MASSSVQTAHDLVIGKARAVVLRERGAFRLQALQLELAEPAFCRMASEPSNQLIQRGK
ncbi:MAG: hypothetical protein ABJC87_11425 [Roseobacter sp.]